MEVEREDSAPPPFGWWESLAVPAVAIVALILFAMVAGFLVYIGAIDALLRDLHADMK
jgi:hypothetical protein